MPDVVASTARGV